MKKLDTIIEKCSKLAQQIHLRSLRDANAITMPLAILAGVMVLINCLVLDTTGFLSGIVPIEVLSTLQEIGNRISSSTLGVWGLAMSLVTSYCLAKNKEYDEPMIPALVSFCSLLTLVPLSLNVTPIGGDAAVSVGGILNATYTGVSGLFTAIIVAIISTEIFIKITKVDILKISMPEMVPPMVSKSFSSIIPFMLVISLFGFIGFMVNQVFGLSVNELIIILIQTPIKNLTTSLVGFLIAMTLFNLLFSIGIHPSAIVGAVIEPSLLLAINENMAAALAGKEATNIINKSFMDVFGLMGGTGCTICLLIAIFLFAKREDHKMIGKLGVGPGLFNINEPIIFGFPIVMNPLMIIPFVLVTQINYILAYFATDFGIIKVLTVQPPWTTPPVISAFLASGGDIITTLFQVGLIALGVLIYLPFLKASEK